MGKCFITRLPSSLKPNPNLRTFNSIRVIEVNPLAPGVEPSYANSAVGNFKYFLKFKSYDKDGNLVYENKSMGGGMQPANVKYIELLDKDKTTGPSYLGNRFQYEDSLSTLCKLKNLRYILSGFSAEHVDCTLNEVSANTKLEVLNLNNTSVTGDISSLSALTNLESLSLAYTSVTGDISSLSALTKLTEINVSNTSVTGDISSLSALTNLTYANLWRTNVTGDISSLSALTNLESLSLAYTSVTGDISNLIDKLTKLKELAIPSTVTITDAQKKTLTDRGCTVYISNN